MSEISRKRPTPPSAQEIQRIFTEHPIFAHLSQKALQQLISNLTHLKPQHFRRGTKIASFPSSSSSDDAFLLVSGSASIYSGFSETDALKHPPLQVLSAGDIIGFSSLVFQNPLFFQQSQRKQPSGCIIAIAGSKELLDTENKQPLAQEQPYPLYESCYAFNLTPELASHFLHLFREFNPDDYIWNLETGCLSTTGEATGEGTAVKVAFYDSKTYMVDAFKQAKEEWESKDKNLAINFRWLEHRLDVDTANMARGCQVVCIFVNDRCTAEVIQQLSKIKIKMIAIRAAGFNNIDLNACEKYGIAVARVPAYSPYAVAEFATAMLLTINRKTHHAYNRIRDYNFTLSRLVGMDMHGKTVGVFGTGKVGKCFIQIMLGFGIKVLCYDIYQSPDVMQLENVRYTDMDTVFRESDFISLHLPLTKETEHLINKNALSKMKKSCLLINTGRGSLVDAQALLHALKHNEIGGAALDVYEEEEQYFFEDHSEKSMTDEVLLQLINQPKVLVTSHQGFLTHEALHAIAKTTISNIRELFVENKRPNELTNTLNKKPNHKSISSSRTEKGSSQIGTNRTNGVSESPIQIAIGAAITRGEHFLAGFDDPATGSKL